MKKVGRADPALSMAVEWMVLLRSGQVGQRERAGFEAWRTESAANQAAYERITRALGSFETLREQGVSGAIAHQSVQGLSRRSVMRATLSVAGLGAGMGAGLLGWQVAADQGLLADQHTGFARRQEESLPDGSTLLMDARTAVDVAFDRGQRTLTLRHGRVLVTATAAGARTPLSVQTPLGQVSTGGAQFVVQQRRDADLLQVTTLTGQVAVATPSGARLEVPSGHRASVPANRPATVAAARGNETLWTRGLIAMDNQPLGELVEALRDYRPGMLRVDPRAAQMRVSGVFSLDDTERTLRALGETQPVRVNRHTPYWVTIESV
ncbi:MAG TPA: FecR domain-containing protein [Burkholderiaceae bacterium]|nr:FecR domain-containing protein [Burkholderiaceae bacterium]